nr:MAG TPA: baseplate protein [Caudoviricetes sp.]
MDKTFDEAIAGIRKAERGVEVREDIAQGMEYVKQYAEEVTGQQQAALQAAQTATGAASTATEKAAAAAESESMAQTAATSAAQSARSASADAKSAGSSAASAKAEADRAAAIVSTDKTLSVDGAPADAKATGDMVKGIKFPIATATTLGGIKSGKGLKISADGTASIDAYNTTEIDSMLNAWQEQVDNKISSAKSITASGDGYIRFADGTQICWLKFDGWSRKGYTPYFPFPVPFANTNYGAGFTLGASITYSTNVECYVFDRTTTGLCVSNAYKGSIVVIGRWK